MSKELLFSITASDCEFKYTKESGAGGQKRNKTSNAVHCFHRLSKAHGYSESTRSQRKNKEEAFVKMANTSEFQNWLKIETAKRSGKLKQLEEQVKYEMTYNTKTEVFKDGEWIDFYKQNEENKT